ncbi:hypothetical protein D3C87_1970750 [compost metagenome]
MEHAELHQGEEEHQDETGPKREHGPFAAEHHILPDRGFGFTRVELLLAVMDDPIQGIEQDEHEDLHNIREENRCIRLVYSSDYFSI